MTDFFALFIFPRSKNGSDKGLEDLKKYDNNGNWHKKKKLEMYKKSGCEPPSQGKEEMQAVPHKKGTIFP